MPRQELLENNFKAGLECEDMDPFQEFAQQSAVPPSMPRPHVPREPALNPNGLPSTVHQSPSLSSLGHPLHQTSLTSLPVRYQPTYTPQHAATYPYIHQPSLDFHREDLHAPGTISSDYYIPLPTASSQGTVLGTNMNAPALDTNGPYLYQNSSRANMYSINASPVTITSSPIPQHWSSEYADDIKGPNIKRRQTTGSSMAMHGYPNGGFMGAFEQSHGLSFLSEHPSASPVY